MQLQADEVIQVVPTETDQILSKKKEENALFKKLQEKLVEQFQHAFPDKLAPKTVVIIPSLTMDEEILSKVSGITHYEERLLCLLLLLRMPRTHVVYVTSMPIDPIIIDYYLHLLPGVTSYHAQQRLSLLSCYDASSKSLTKKILERPRLIERIKKIIPVDCATHMACFNVTSLERTLALQLGMPIFGCDPELFDLGNKSNGRKIFKESGLLVPDGFEDLYTEEDIARALDELKIKHPSLKKAVVKINDGFSGDGNAVFYFESVEETGSYERIKKELSIRLKMVATELNYEMFISKFGQMGGIVEVFVEGEIKTSPSVQCRINPTGDCDVVSTHDQELGGDTGQIFIGAHFPAHEDYAGEIGRMGKAVAENLKQKGVIGRFAVDFISVKEEGEWKHYAIEINLRKGGTTHPYIMLEFLTDGVYDAEKGIYFTATGQQRFYFSSDNLKSEKYIGTTPHDLIDIAMLHDLHYDGALQEGVMFHLIGALSQFGKLGVVCVGSSRERVQMYYDRTIEVLDLECYHDSIPQVRI
jgi:hypothetical protein